MQRLKPLKAAHPDHSWEQLVRTSTYLHLPPLTSTYLHLPPLTSTYLHVPPLTSTYLHFPPLTSTYLHGLLLSAAGGDVPPLGRRERTSTFCCPPRQEGTYLHFLLPSAAGGDVPPLSAALRGRRERRLGLFVGSLKARGPASRSGSPRGHLRVTSGL